MKSIDKTPAYPHPWREKNRKEEGVRNAKSNLQLSIYVPLSPMPLLPNDRTSLQVRHVCLRWLSKMRQNSEFQTWKILLLSLQCSLTCVGALSEKEKNSESSKIRLRTAPWAGNAYLRLFGQKQQFIHVLQTYSAGTKEQTPSPLHHAFLQITSTELQQVRTSQLLNHTVLQTRQPPYLGGLPG